MTLDPRDLEQISAGTLADYARRAAQYREGTKDHDVSQNIAELLRHLEGAPPFRILDLGCGPGRDLKVFRDLGHEAVGLEGLPEFAAMARRDSGCEVLEQDFLRLELPAASFDGIFANASMFHVPTQELPRVLKELRAALKLRGVLFCSIPHGDNQEGWNRGRYGAFLDWETWQGHVTAAGFTELNHYYRPAGLPRNEQPWLASSWRRVTALTPRASPA
ncbi:MAG TPA: class I SAM-dependent methyltransferase [Burkholderiales bacterium]|nr:class I SAM-dependent methyltransferase [Burkholderiales bacterium]